MPPLRTPSGFAASQRFAKGYGPLFTNIEGINLNLLMKKALAVGMNQAEGAAAEAGRAFFGALNQYRSGGGGSRSLASANSELALRAQAAVVASYDERVEGRKKGPSYRIGENRYSGGALRRALSDPDMFVGTYQGVSFMNVSILDREAKHWARLNWGAGRDAQAGQYEPKRASFKVFSTFLGSLTPASLPQAPFKMPPGVFVGGYGAFEGATWKGKGPGFYPRRKRPLRFPTKGIEQRRFFDAAYSSIGANMTPVYTDLLNEWIAQAKGTIPRGLIHKAGLAGVVNYF